MTKFLLSQWEAIELFSKVVCKYENTLNKSKSEKNGTNFYPLKIEEFSNNGFLMQTLRRYENPIYYRPFGDIQMLQIARQERISRHYPKTLYNLSLDIRFSVPVVRSMDEILLLLIFIDEKENLKNYKALDLWIPNDRQRTFENTRWYLYYYEEYISGPLDVVKQTGISRAIVYFYPFARLVIKDIDASNGEHGREDIYVGQYSIYGGPKGHYLLLEARLGGGQFRDLHILLHIGDNEFRSGEIALGQFHNVHNTIYSGTVIMEKTSQRGGLKPMFFKTNDKQVDQVYWDFFKDKFKNRIRVKSGLKLKSTLKLWIEKKRT